MADIRINALATTAASTASDDYIAIDGTTNGTRKLNAYSPTFGGNLTSSGDAGGSGGHVITSADYGTSGVKNGFQLTASNSTNTSSRNWAILQNVNAYGDLQIVQSNAYGGSPITAGTAALSFDASRNATLAGNLTVSGGQALTIGSSANYSLWKDGTPTKAGRLILNTNVTNGLSLGLYDGSSWVDTLHIHPTNNNVLIGTNINSGNGKLQLADHTTSAGGIGFGTDTSIFRTSNGRIAIDALSASTVFLELNLAGAKKGEIAADASNVYVGSAVGGLNTIIRSGAGTTALTLDSSQNATFAGTVSISKANPELAIRSASDAAGQIQYLTFGSPAYNRSQFRVTSAGTSDGSIALYTFNAGSAVLSQTWDKSGNATFAGSIAIGNTVQTAASVASTHKVTVVIGGVTYYLLATNV